MSNFTNKQYPVIGLATNMTLLDWFATFAPEPEKCRVMGRLQLEHNKVKHDQDYMPKGEEEIKCELRYLYAATMLKMRP